MLFNAIFKDKSEKENQINNQSLINLGNKKKKKGKLKYKNSQLYFLSFQEIKFEIYVYNIFS